MSPAATALERLAGGRWVGGPLSRMRFTRILGLEPAPPPLAVSGVLWVDDHLQLTVELPPPARATLTVHARDGRDGPITTDQLVMRVVGEAPPPPVLRLIERSVARRLGGVDLGRLAALLLDDPELTGVLGPLEGQRKAGGAHTKARLSALLGLEGAAEIESVAWVSDHVELAIAAPDEPPVRFQIHAREPDSRGIVVVSDLVVSYVAKELPDAISAPMRRLAPTRLRDWTLARLGALMAADPELGRAGLSAPSTEHTHPTNMVDTWGGKDAYCDFFAGGEIARCQLDSVSFNKFFRNVQHCDIECLLVNPHSQAEAVMMVDYPWENRTRNIGAPPHEVAPESRPEWSEGDAMVTTDLREQDVIMGSSDKLRAALEYAVQQPNPQNKPIFVANTCVPTVTGEDVESVVREVRERTGQRLLYLTVSPKSMNDVFVDLFESQRLAAEATAGPPHPRRVNLIGFPDTRAVRELRGLLARLSIEVGVLLLPDLDAERIGRLPEAALNVFCPNRLWSHMYEQLRRGTRIGHIAPPAPYGVDRTRRWAAAVVQGLSLPIDFDSAWRQALVEHEAAYEAARARAAGQRLALVVRGEETHYLTDPDQTWGVPLLAFAEEAGFGLDVLLEAQSPRRAERGAERIRAVFGAGASHRLSTFADFDELRRQLRDSEAAAVLSNHFFDWRIAEAGKSRFSLQHFEMGLAGAVRTIERLTAACELPFYRRYRRYLARTADGLRAAPESA